MSITLLDFRSVTLSVSGPSRRVRRPWHVIYFIITLIFSEWSNSGRKHLFLGPKVWIWGVPPLTDKITDLKGLSGILMTIDN